MLVEKSKKIKLIRKTSTSFFWTSFILMCVSTIALYFYLSNLLRNEVEEGLFSTEDRIEVSLESEGTTYELPPVIEVKIVAKLGVERLKDTVIYDPSQNEMEEFRELTTFKKINGKNYSITVRALIVESNNILIAVVLFYLFIIILVFVFFFYFNKARNQRLWQPFFTSLEQMKKFSLTSPEQLQLANSNILEFDELNKQIETLTNKVKTDYINLKQFTENVSHEIQTPLAIIQAKIENIINSENLNDIQFKNLTSIQKDIQRLTQMNKRLTLLTKIENNQFMNIERISLSKLLEEKIQNFLEISMNEIKYTKIEEIWVRMDPYLAEVLCNNLLSNAIKHGDKGYIDISLSHKMLSIANYGLKPLMNPENLYTRFYRESTTEKSTGLGLAIVKRICELYGFRITYEFIENRHIFKIYF